MEHSGETKLLSSNPEINSSQLEHTAGPQQELPEGEHVYNLGYNALSYYQLKTAAEREARIYMASKPMNDSGAKNVALHGSIIRLFNGISRQPTYDDLIVMREALDYRMNQVMGVATTYKNFWDLDMPDCHKFDVEANFFGRNIIDAFDWVCADTRCSLNRMAFKAIPMLRGTSMSHAA
ncbi:hypothetical protein V502_06771 [Pseudogymnoascus sp. VKM F-4520 (FW-2644)]|nr:hypothetical protein V502_06771 [Pseudogymnoascus sp. VKM F-4520 (FW-2644)]